MPRKPKKNCIVIPYPVCTYTDLGTTKAPNDSMRRYFKVCCENLCPSKAPVNSLKSRRISPAKKER